MNETIVLLASTLAAGFCFAATLDDVPWIGDGRPEREGADWYAEDPAPEFCAEFVLPEGVSEAKISFACAGFGWFRVESGGAFMTADGLDTLWSVYDKTVYSRTTRSVNLKPCPAVNRVYVNLGNGFYNLPPLCFWGSKCFREALSHGRPCFKLAIDVVDKPLEWKWRETDVVRNAVYLGSEVDATRRDGKDPWKPAAVVKGPKGRIVEWPRSNPQMITADIHHGEVKWLREGEVQVVDFGVNASGVPSFTFRDEQRGSRIEIVYGERLNDDGSVNVLTQAAGQVKKPGKGGPGAPDIACQRDAYVCRGPRKLPPMTVTSGDTRAETFRPPFTWHVFRYAEIRGAKHLVADATRHVRSMLSLLVRQGAAAKAFKTDDPELAAIHEICRRTFQANMIGGVQSDCPGRERLGYGGDIVATCEAYMLNFDMREIYLKVLRDFADEAEDDGWLTETAPYVGIADAGFGGRSGPISWALAVPELIDGLLRHYDETRALEFYPVCARYVRLVDGKCPSGIVPRCIGDHEALERAPDGCTATAHWHRFVDLTLKFARRLGREDDAREFAALEAKIRAAFVEKYVKNGIVANGTQSAQSLGLYLGLVPADQVAAAERRLVDAVEEKGCGPTTGIFTTRYMLMYLSEHGRVDLARRIVLH
ncbi:MAG: family 78 glycoside hydrolase catalytic domain, partial [Kiritimatiellae bacterium]|nr:family 78 glycoside hydrolase catalytic domain [Kiritimatiellia bacterium]